MKMCMFKFHRTVCLYCSEESQICGVNLHVSGFLSLQHAVQVQSLVIDAQWSFVFPFFLLFFALHFDRLVYLDNCLKVKV